MHCIVSENTDPHFNLASEEYLLKSFHEDVFLVYRNVPSIVVGKHQNALAEINLSFVRDRKIMVARRISGGGTVFHDLGNLNFAFITNGKEGQLVDYRKHTMPVIEALATLGLNVRLGERNELLLGGKKISGTASHVFKKRVLHHGTLLFSTSIEDLSASLIVKSDTFSDRAVKSVSSRVINIRDQLTDDMDVVEFRDVIVHHILKTYEGSCLYNFNTTDLKEIRQLQEDKFATWAWNYGYSPKYRFENEIQTRSGVVSVVLKVEKGIIREFSITGEFNGLKEVSELESLISGTNHDPESIRNSLSKLRVEDYVGGLGNEDLLTGMF